MVSRDASITLQLMQCSLLQSIPSHIWLKFCRLIILKPWPGMKRVRARGPQDCISHPSIILIWREFLLQILHVQTRLNQFEGVIEDSNMHPISNFNVTVNININSAYIPGDRLWWSPRSRKVLSSRHCHRPAAGGGSVWPPARFCPLQRSRVSGTVSHTRHSWLNRRSVWAGW